MHRSQSYLELQNLSFTYPTTDQPLFTNLSLALGKGLVGLIGDNGCGKTTLLRLIAGELTPQSGTLLKREPVYFLKQSHCLDPNQSIGSFLQIEHYLEAWDKVESGVASDEDFALLDGHWDVQERYAQLLQSVGLPALPHRRLLSEISGGEATRLALAAIEDAKPALVLMDEPSNNLDLESRRLLSQTLERQSGLVLLSTHDRSLLRQVEQIIEIQNGQLLLIHGNYDTYLEHIRLLEESAQRRALDAKKELKKVKQQYQAIEQRQAKQRKFAAKATRNKRDSKMAMNGLKRKAQVSAGKENENHQKRLLQIQEKQQEAEGKLRKAAHIRLGELASEKTLHRQILTLEDRSHKQWVIGGGERVALLGENGIGKSRLIDSIFDPNLRQHLHAWGVGHRDSIAVIRQNVLDLREENTLLEELTSGDKVNRETWIRTHLARMLFSQDAVFQTIGTLSGGQRFHIALAKLLVHQPPFEMIVLDEPTNNLDLASLQQVAGLLQEYSGALLVVSHDLDFLRDIGIERFLVLDEKGLQEWLPPVPSQAPLAIQEWETGGME